VGLVVERFERLNPHRCIQSPSELCRLKTRYSCENVNYGILAKNKAFDENHGLLDFRDYLSTVRTEHGCRE